MFRDVKNRNRKPGREKRNSLIFIYGLRKNTSDVCEICYTLHTILGLMLTCRDRLFGLVVRVSGYRYRGPGFDPRRYQIF